MAYYQVEILRNGKWTPLHKRPYSLGNAKARMSKLDPRYKSRIVEIPSVPRIEPYPRRPIEPHNPKTVSYHVQLLHDGQWRGVHKSLVAPSISETIKRVSSINPLAKTRVVEITVETNGTQQSVTQKVVDKHPEYW